MGGVGGCVYVCILVLMYNMFRCLRVNVCAFGCVCTCM